MAYELPSLRYAYDALEPHFDARTMEIHHTRHHQAYIGNANGVLDNGLFPEQKGRSWLFRTVGFGHDDFTWRAFVSALRQAGYDDVLSIEQEDPLIEAGKGLELAVGVLQNVLI